MAQPRRRGRYHERLSSPRFVISLVALLCCTVGMYSHTEAVRAASLTSFSAIVWTWLHSKEEDDSG